MADKSIILRSVQGAALNATQNDQNLDSLAGVVDAQTGTTYTVLYTDQNKTIELNNASMVCTLSAISTIAAAIQSSKWKVTLKNINATAAEVKNNAADTIDGTDYSSTGISLKQYEAITLQINNAGTGWIIIGDKSETFASIDVNGGAIDGTTVGASSASTGAFTTLTGTVVTASTSLTVNGSTAITSVDTDLSSVSASDDTIASAKAIKAYTDSKISTDPSGTGTLSTGGTMEVFVSALETYSGGGFDFTPQSHGLSGNPHEFHTYARCTAAGTSGFTVGDTVPLDLINYSSLSNAGFTAWASSTQVGGHAASGGVRILDKANASFLLNGDSSTWDIFIVAKYYA